MRPTMARSYIRNIARISTRASSQKGYKESGVLSLGWLLPHRGAEFTCHKPAFGGNPPWQAWRQHLTELSSSHSAHASMEPGKGRIMSIPTHTKLEVAPSGGDIIEISKACATTEESSILTLESASRKRQCHGSSKTDRVRRRWTQNSPISRYHKLKSLIGSLYRIFKSWRLLPARFSNL